jgi:hypothetical protein
MRNKRPRGQPTRGKTALNRLRQIDVFVALAYPQVLMAGSSLVIDVGYGAQAWTTLEMAERWRRINPRLRALGLEIDPVRVAAAQPYADPPRLAFKLGGFNVVDVLLRGEQARIIRAYNVLRQYDEAEIAPALAQMAQGLEIGGLLIEGTSSPFGRMVAFDVYQRTSDGLQHEALVFGSNFRADLEAEDFQTILPKRLIHHMLDDAPAQFFAAWQQCMQRARWTSRRGVRGRWIEAGLRLREQYGYRIDPRLRLLRRGYLVVLHALMPS